MASRNELNIRARAVGFDASTIPNDSKLEQKVLYLEKRQTTISGTAATTTLTSSGVAVADETIVVNGVTYTFRAAVDNTVANEIKIGAAATNTLDNIKDAINGTESVAVRGTDYSQLTKRHPDVTAGAKDATTLVIASTDSNANGAFTTTETMTNWAFTGATASAGVNGSVVSASSTTAGAPGLSGDKNTTL